MIITHAQRFKVIITHAIFFDAKMGSKKLMWAFKCYPWGLSCNG